MPHREVTQLPELTPPNPFADIAAAMQGKPSPTKEFELQSINRRLAQAQEQRAQGQEHREIADQRLKQFGAISTIAKVISTIGPSMDEATKDTISLSLAKEAEADGMPIKDPKFFRALMKQPREMADFLDSFVQSTQAGKPVIESLRNAAKGVTDNETLKLIGDVFKSSLTKTEKQGKAISPSDVDALIASEGKIIGETIPEGFTLPMAKVFQAEQMKKRQVLVPEAFGQAVSLTREKALEQPLPPGVQKDLDATNNVLRNVDQAIANFDPSFVGPLSSKVSGVRETFGETPVVGTLLGGALSNQEANFRGSLAAARNAIRNKEFGAALTTFEAAEADKALANIGKSPAVTKAALVRLKDLLSAGIERQSKFATTSRRELKDQPGQTQATPPLPPGFIRK